MNLFGSVFQRKSVFVTGHTGFKGSWLCEWLLALGAKVTGYSLPLTDSSTLFHQLSLQQRLKHIEGDIRDSKSLAHAVEQSRPDFVFHLAAQPLVRDSYENPEETFVVNAIGTLRLLEILRILQKPCSAIFVTTDKCYENQEWIYGYREEDKLGGRDPYSASKAAAEIIIQSYRASFFKDHPVRIASARAGNVIGGGDWAKDRIVPDCVRALQKKQTIAVRNKTATRPWQHVLEPLSGYLWLASTLSNPKLANCPVDKLTSAFNFGPSHDSNRSVADLVQEILMFWPGKWKDDSDPLAVHEARLLQLSTDKANAFLKWSPVWNFSEAIEQTVKWYRTPEKQALFVTQGQIAEYCAAASRKEMVWSRAAVQKVRLRKS